MTIGIGVVCTHAKQPDHLVLLADTQGSTGNTQSTERLHKIFVAPESATFGAAADHIPHAGELFSVVSICVGKTDGTYSDQVRAIHEGMDFYKRRRFALEVAPRYAHKVGTFNESFKESDLSPALLQEWKEFYVGCQLIIGTFDREGRAGIHYLDGCGLVECYTIPGQLTIGTGSENAQFWLNYRSVHMGMPVLRAAYCAFEAKVMAENSSFVNTHLDMLVANAREHAFTSDDRAVVGNLQTTVSLAELRRLFLEYGPKDINAIT